MATLRSHELVSREVISWWVMPAAGYAPPQLPAIPSLDNLNAESASALDDSSPSAHGQLPGFSRLPGSSQEATPPLHQLSSSSQTRAVSETFSSMSVEGVRGASGSGTLPDGASMHPHRLQVSLHRSGVHVSGIYFLNAKEMLCLQRRLKRSTTGVFQPALPKVFVKVGLNRGSRELALESRKLP